MNNVRKMKSGSDSILEKETALVTSEDDRLRSQYILSMVQERKGTPLRAKGSQIPHVVVQFWDTATSIPLDVRKCMDSWKTLKDQGFDYILFNDELAKAFIAEHFDARHLDAFELCRHPAMRADYFRLCYLIINGGFYVDADDMYKGGNLDAWFNGSALKLHPLCYNAITDSMVNVSDSIENPRDFPELIFYVNNNPIISSSHHPVLCIALERSTKILLNQEKKDRQDVQSMTGPGNLTASLVYHAIYNDSDPSVPDFMFLSNWDDISESQWDLEYRKDRRNWRLWNGYDA